MIGSVVYAGLVLGSCFGGILFNKFSSHVIIKASIAMYLISLALVITENITAIYISRFFVGFFQVFLVIYFPVWIDNKGETSKTIWLTLMQLGCALGVVAGYLITSLIVQFLHHWIYAYYLQIAILLPCLIYYCLQEQDLLDASPQVQKQSMEEAIRGLVKNDIFVYTMLALCALFFVVTGMQFWITDYMREVLQQPQEWVFKAYIFTSLTAPIIGVASGGYLLHKLGGYDGEHGLKFALSAALLASISGTPIPYTNSPYIVLACLWLLFYFGGAAVPAITGIMICSIPQNNRSLGNSISHLFQEMLGYLPSPMIYGLVNHQREGMTLLTTWGYLGVLFLGLALRSEMQRLTEERIQSQMKMKFSEFRRNNSLSVGQSIYEPIQRSLSLQPEDLKQTLRKRSTMQFKIQDYSHFLARKTIEFQDKDEGVIQKKDEIELQMPQKQYLLSTGGYT